VTALNAGCDMVLLCNQSVDGGEAVDDLINGLSEALLKGQWQPNPSSDERRGALLPTTPAPVWDELMVSAPYMHALD
jgi:beta-N-acetylhexosaminidase